MLHSIMLGFLFWSASVSTPEQQALIARLERALLAPCCYQEVVATHNSQEAKAMRAEIAELVAAGRSEREVLAYYKQRYGARVLAEPEGRQWWVMNVVPVAILAAGAAFVVHLLLRWRRRPAPAGA